VWKAQESCELKQVRLEGGIQWKALRIVICTNFVEFMQSISSLEERLSSKVMKFSDHTKLGKSRNKICRWWNSEWLWQGGGAWADK